MNSKRIAALFDFDGTLTRRDTMAPFLLFTLRHCPKSFLDLPGLIPWAIGYKLGKISKEQMKGKALRLYKRVPPDRRQKLLRQFHDEALLPRYLPRGVERVRWHREQGHILLLVSASVDVFLESASHSLGFDRLICTRAVLDPAPRIVGANCYGEEKVRRLKELDLFQTINWPNSYAYSDHISDLPMLRLCGHPVAANPKADLRQLAQSEGFEIVDW
jgi:phosphatidylglycerophosphatase C